MKLIPFRTTSRIVSLTVTMLMALAGAIAITTASSVVAPSIANATCGATLDGTWRNINASTPSITRVDLQLRSCGDQVLCDAETGQCWGTQTSYALRAFGKCHPTDCDWGIRYTTSMSDGWHRAIYQYSWATKSVWVKAYQYYGRTYLRVWVYTDFTAADGRTDYITDEWMLR
jgi:hypothetical protein